MNICKYFKDYKTFVVMMLIVILLYCLSWWYIDSEYSSLTERGTFGDKFGAVNALYSGLAFAGLIFTIVLQRKELGVQREELRLTRQEMRNQTAEFNKQNTTLQYQRFENTFFNLLSQFEDVTNQLTFSYAEDNQHYDYAKKYNGNNVVLRGRELFRSAFEDVPHYTMNASDRIKRKGMRGLLTYKGMGGYMESYTPTYFDHYFRLMYRILKYVAHSSLIKDTDKYEYVCILRALLSRYELVWLYYNGLSDYGVEKLKPYIEEYAMLKNLRKELLVENLELPDGYSNGAFRHI